MTRLVTSMRPKYPCACGPGICGLVRRAHYLFAAGLFAILGFHVGIWAVQLASLSASLSLDPAALGAAITVAAAAGLVTLFAGGMLADRVRPAPGPGDRLRRYRDRLVLRLTPAASPP